MAPPDRRAMRGHGVRSYLAGLALVVAGPIILFTIFLLLRFADAERSDYEEAALLHANRAGRAIDAELGSLLSALDALAGSASLGRGDFAAFHDEASRFVKGKDEIVLLREFGQRQLLNTQRPFGTELPPAIPIAEPERAAFAAGQPVISSVFFSPISGEPRVAVARTARAAGQALVLAITIPTTRIRDVLVSSAPPGWFVAAGDAKQKFVARSERHEEMSGKPASAEYYEKAVGDAGHFTSYSIDGDAVLAGYRRSKLSNWLVAANIPRSVVEAPLWTSLAWAALLGLAAVLISVALAVRMGTRFHDAANLLVEQAGWISSGAAIRPISTRVREFDRISEAFAQANEVLRQRSQELEAVVSTVPAAVWFSYDPKVEQIARNAVASELMGVAASDTRSFTQLGGQPGTVEMRKGERRLRPEELPLQRAFAGEAIVGDEYDFVYPDGSSRVVLISARPIFGVGGSQVGAVAVGLDITERKLVEEQRRLLTNELNHRVKNTLAIVQSIALHTLRSSDYVEQAGERLESRLLALSRAHDILNRESWTGADIVEVANVTLPIEMGKIRTEGPAVWLRPTTAVTISLILHELATNATKHGAFRSPGGEAAFRWRIVDAGEGRRLEAHWSESGGPPVSEPARIGFGTRLIKRLVTAEPGGAISQDYAWDGFQCRFGFMLQPWNRREGKSGASGAEQ